MKMTRVFAKLAVTAGIALLVSPLVTTQANAQDQPEAPAPKVRLRAPYPDSLKAINDDFDRQLLQLERGRLDRLSRLAQHQRPAEAAATYEQLFRLAIASNLFQEAGPAAASVVQAGSPAPTTVALAHLVKIIAEADRGMHEQSLETLKQAFGTAQNAAAAGRPRATLQAGELTGICDAYYQRLVHADQFKLARQAFQLALEHTQSPVVKEFLLSRLKRLDLVGKPAPPIEGTDLDGKPFSLARLKGKVVLVEFWASWCLPSAEEVEWFQGVAQSRHAKGLEVVGINLDTLQEGGQKLETVLPNVRRFLLDHNVSWPNLVNGSGAVDFARAYGVTDIPASVLIGRDGTIVHIDLVRKNLETVIDREINR